MLIKCPDCGKMFSEYAERCPVCGCPTVEAKKTAEPKKEENKTFSKEIIQLSQSDNENINDLKTEDANVSIRTNNSRWKDASEVRFLSIAICIALFVLLVLFGFIMHNNRQNSPTNAISEIETDTVTIAPTLTEDKEEKSVTLPMTFYSCVRYNSGYDEVPEDVLDASRALEICLTPPHDVIITESVQDMVTYRGTYDIKDSIITMNVKGVFDYAIVGVINDRGLTITRSFCLNNEEYNNTFLNWGILSRK